MLAGAARGWTGSKGGGGLVRSSDVDTRELAGFKVPPLAAPANTGQSSSTADEGRSAG